MNQPRPEPTPSTGTSITRVALLAGIWLLCHPYSGIWHDGVLYAAQALRRLRPEVFERDIFFRFGSQDDLSVFSLVYAPVIERFGVPWASLAFVAAGQALWAIAAVRLLRRVLPPAHFIVGTALVLSVPLTYGPDGVLHPAEAIATPRLFAEAMGLFGLSSIMDGRRRTGLFILLAAFLVHPLMAVAPAGAGLLVVLQGFVRRFSVAAFATSVVAGPAAALAVIGIVGPVVMDREWYEAVQIRSPMVTPGVWSLNDWAALVFPPGVIAAALAAGLRPPAKALAVAVLGTSVSGIALAVVAEHSRWALLLQAQPWRVAWLHVLMAPVLAVAALGADWTKAPASRSMMLAAIPALIYSGELVLEIGATMAMVFLCSAVAIGWIERRGSSVALRLIGQTWLLANCVAAAAWSAVRGAAFDALAREAGGGGLATLSAYLKSSIWLSALAFLIVAVNYRGAACSQRGPRRVLLGAGAAVCLLFGMVLWDMRTPLARFQEEPEQTAVRTWRMLIPASATVFWQGQLKYPWLVLERSSYLSVQQFAGLAFSRAMTTEGLRRISFTRHLGLSFGSLAIHHGAPAWYEIAQPTKEGLGEACEDEALDFVVLRERLAEEVLGEFAEAVTGTTYYLYACAPHRGGRDAAAGSVDAGERRLPSLK